MVSKKKRNRKTKEKKEEYETFNVLLLSYSIILSAFIAFVSLVFSSKIILEGWLKILIYISFFLGIMGLVSIIDKIIDNLKSRKMKISITIGILFLITTPLIIILVFSISPPYSARLSFGFPCPDYLNKNSQNEIITSIENMGEIDGRYSISLIGDNVTFRESGISYENFKQNLTIYRVIGPEKPEKNNFDIYLGDIISASFIVKADCIGESCSLITTRAYKCEYKQQPSYTTQIHLVNQTSIG